MSKAKGILARITSITSTKKITQAMKMVSAAKLAKFQVKSEKLDYYLIKLKDIISSILSNLDNQKEKNSSALDKLNNPFLNNSKKENDKDFNKKNISKALYIIIGSDKGLCGSFNSKLFKQAENEINKATIYKEIITLMPIGKKSSVFVNNLPNNESFKIIEDFSTLNTNLDYESSEKFSDFILKEFINKKYTDIYIIHNKLKGSHSNILIDKFLPLDLESNENQSNSEIVDYIFEPSPDELIQDLIPKILKLKIFSALLGSLTAEHSIRMIAMTKATDNADDILKELKLIYNRTRQAAITKELTEIVGGAEALSSGH